MKRLALTLTAASLLAATTLAQTETTAYQPGVTTEGAIYFLPKTAIRVTVQIEKTTYTPGDFAPYAQRYLRLNHVATEPQVSYRVINVRQEAIGVPDQQKAYAVKFNAKTVAANVALSPEGVLLAINGEPRQPQLAKPFKAAPRPAATNPRQFMNEEILAAGSTAKMAELTAQEIYDLRDSRSQLIKGQADFMPQDGAQMKLMLAQLDEQDQALTSLFAGTNVCDTTETTFTVTPVSAFAPRLLFRFSTRLGMLDEDDLAGTPYYITVENLGGVPTPAATNDKKKKEGGIFVNVPAKMRSTILSGTEQVATNEFPCAQFGNIELLSGELFNKHYTTHLWLNPTTGAVDRLEAEQPK